MNTRAALWSITTTINDGIGAKVDGDDLVEGDPDEEYVTGSAEYS
jgi:hypothetical protein